MDFDLKALSLKKKKIEFFRIPNYNFGFPILSSFSGFQVKDGEKLMPYWLKSISSLSKRNTNIDK